MPRNPAIYLAGPINGQADDVASEWRDYVAGNYPGTIISPLVRDYRGREDENVSDIVNLDKQDIRGSDLVLANCPFPSYGTAMEIFYAYTLDKPVVVIVPGGTPVSPWIRYHATALVNSVEEGLDLILNGDLLR